MTPALHSTMLGLLLLAGCSKADRSDGAASAQQRAAQPAAQLAYSYTYRFRLPSNRLAAAQRRHIAMCTALGPRCRLLETHGGGYGARTSGSSEAGVASGIAARFGDGLAGPVRELGGAQTSSDVAAEDLSRQIVDMGARVRAKEMLAARLTRMLETRAGSTADLVATEKAVAEVQEQLDAARTAWRRRRGGSPPRRSRSATRVRRPSRARRRGVRRDRRGVLGQRRGPDLFPNGGGAVVGVAGRAVLRRPRAAAPDAAGHVIQRAMVVAALALASPAAAQVAAPAFPLACSFGSTTDGLDVADACAAQTADGLEIAPAVLKALAYERGLASIAIHGSGWFYRRRDGRTMRMITLQRWVPTRSPAGWPER